MRSSLACFLQAAQRAPEGAAADSVRSEMSSIPSSQWSSRKHELYDTLNSEEQDLFDELQDEIEELKNLLHVRDKKEAAHKVRFIALIALFQILPVAVSLRNCKEQALQVFAWKRCEIKVEVVK